MPSILDRLRGTTEADYAVLDSPILTEAETADAQVEMLRESIAQLERALDEPGWRQINANLAQQFTDDGLRRIRATCRLMWLANPLIQRATNVRLYYVWGQGVEIYADADGEEGQDVNAVVQQFIDDPGNQQAMFGHQAIEDLEKALHTDGNLVISLFTEPRTGQVQVRLLNVDEIQQVIRNPDDAQDVWYYLRRWQQPATPGGPPEVREAYYPDVRHRPRTRPRIVNGKEVRWDTPIYHVKVGGLHGWDYGVPEVYSAVPWAKAYKNFLEDWAALAKSLATFAWQVKSKGTKAQRDTLKANVPKRYDADTGVTREAGATAVTSPDVTLQAVGKTGATMDADSGRPLAMMVAAAMDVPYTILMGDADMGNLATAKTLDRPTELGMRNRQELWKQIYSGIFDHVIDQAVRAPQGPLRGTVTRDAWGRMQVELADDTPRTVNVQFPPILEHDVAEVVGAIAEADATGKVPAREVARLLLVALGVSDVDEIMAEFGDELEAEVARQADAGNLAVRAFRQGQDPSELLR